MLLMSKVLLVCLIVLTQINENAADTEARIRKKHNTMENREVLKKLVALLNDNERTNTHNEEPSLIKLLDGVEIRNRNELRNIMKHIQKNYDYQLMSENTQLPRVHLVRNPDILEEFSQHRGEAEIYTPTPDVLKSTVRRYGDIGYGQAMSGEGREGKRNGNFNKKSKYMERNDKNNKRNSRFDSRERFDNRNNKNKKSYYVNDEKFNSRQKYDSREKFSKNDRFDKKDRFDSREKYHDKRNNNNNKEINNNRNKENNNNRYKDKYERSKENIGRNKYDTNKFDKKEKSSFQGDKRPGSRIRSRDDDFEKGLDIPDNSFKKPPIITLNLGLSRENSNYVRKRDETSKDRLDEGRKGIDIDNDRGNTGPKNENRWGNREPKKENRWGSPDVQKANDWSQIGVEKSPPQKGHNDWSQVGVDKATLKKEWANFDEPKDWDLEKKPKKYYHDDDITTQFAPANNNKRNDDWDQPIKHYENKYKDRIEKVYNAYDYKKRKSDVRSEFGYSFGRTPIPFVGKRIVYADN